MSEADSFGTQRGPGAWSWLQDGPTPTRIAAVLMAGVSAALVCSACAAVWLIVGDMSQSDGVPGGLRFWLGRGLEVAGRLASPGSFVLLIAVAALWWQVGVVADAADDAESASREEAALIRRLLQAAGVLLLVCGVAAVAALLGAGLILSASQGGPLPDIGVEVLYSFADTCLVLAVVYAGRIALRSMTRDLNAIDRSIADEPR